VVLGNVQHISALFHYAPFITGTVAMALLSTQDNVSGKKTKEEKKPYLSRLIEN
jgi:hypothetical protein